MHRPDIPISADRAAPSAVGVVAFANIVSRDGVFG
jgi:hypothetical protein